jgi:hypothetical protein
VLSVCVALLDKVLAVKLNKMAEKIMVSTD